jgi:hypothetical protein
MSLERGKLSRPVLLRRDEDEVLSNAGESEELDQVDGSTDDSVNDTDDSGKDVGNRAGFNQ